MLQRLLRSPPVRDAGAVIAPAGSTSAAVTHSGAFAAS